MLDLNKIPILKSLDSNYKFNLDNDKNIFMLGQKRNAEFKLKHTSIEQEHAHLTRDLCGIKLAPISGLTKINNQEIKEPIRLSNGDIITFGDLNYTFFEDEKNIVITQKNNKKTRNITMVEKIFLISFIINLFLLCLTIPIITNSIINF